MAFYTETENSGNFLPYISYNAKSDKWAAKVGEEKVALKGDIVFAADFGNLKTGWFLFMEGSAPSIVMDASLTEPAAKPNGNHKRGVKFNVLLKGDNAGVYEFSSNSKLVLQSLNALHDDFIAGQKDNTGKVPVVKVLESEEVKSSFKNLDGSQGTATNYQPVFKIEKWIDRPAEFNEALNDNAPQAQVPAPVAASASEF